MQKYLWRFKWEEMYAMHEGLFVASEDEVKELIGKEVYFGESDGKHSEVFGTVEEGEITRIDIDMDTIKKVSSILGETWCGYNPLEFIR